MIITKQFVLIHLHKSGGQTLNKVIRDCIEDHRSIGYHYPRSMIPADAKGLPIVGVVRNPWAWYVSWYFFNKQHRVQNPLFAVVSDGGRADFTTAVRNLIKLGTDSDDSVRHRAMLMNVLPDALHENRGVGLTRNDMEDIHGTEMGYYTWLFDRMLGIAACETTHIGRFEMLQQEFTAIMRQLGVPEADAIEKALQQGRRRNTSLHSHYSHYYDDELRMLVASKEHAVIERFGYSFAAIGSGDAALAAAAHNTNEFRKLLGRADDFLLLGRALDTGALEQQVAALPESAWEESDRSQRFHVHADTRSLILLGFSEHLHKRPEIQPRYAEFIELIEPLLSDIAEFYQDNGFALRILLARLCAHGEIATHVDKGYSLLQVHRLHMPLITNDATIFTVNGHERHMRVGECWEINNGLQHSVVNRGTKDRVHMIIDWMPNRAGREIVDAIDAVSESGMSQTAADPESRDALIAQAYQYQRAGQVHRAETGYRYLLDMDPDNAVCNNLMGMLCRQTHRYDEAVKYIERAIKAVPQDAKSHSNLGQALLMLGQFAKAASSFRNALALDPMLESARSGLERAERGLNRPGQV